MSTPRSIREQSRDLSRDLSLSNRERLRTILEPLDLDALLSVLTFEARRWHDGHFTIMAFTTEYKVTLGTPNLLRGSYDPTAPDLVGGTYKQIWEMPGFPTLKDALIHALVEHGVSNAVNHGSYMPDKKER